ncbi:MAG: hypothetical protein ACI9MC_003224 [Kiritimatiellia bacterium]
MGESSWFVHVVTLSLLQNGDGSTALEANMTKTVLIVGVTGGQGSAAARALLASGWLVRGLTRHTSSDGARSMAEQGVQLVQGDLDDSSAVAKAMAGVDAVFAVTNWFKVGVEREVRWGKMLAQAAIDADVSHFVYASAICADQATGVPHFESKGEVERYLRDLPMQCTILRPGIFMEDLTDARYVPAASWGMMPRLVGRDTPIPWVALDDIGAAVASALDAQEGPKFRVVELVGDVRSMREARVAFRVSGRKVFGLPMPAWLFERMVSAELVNMWRWLGRSEKSWSCTDPTLRDMNAWLRMG